MAEKNELEQVRLDRWLFAVRLFRTRSLAAKAIASGRVKMDGHAVKAHRPVRVGDEIYYRDHGRTLKIEVVALLEKRVGAAEARPCYNLVEDPDLQPEVREMVKVYRELARSTPKPKGRPTKKDRRQLQKLKEDPD